MEININYLKGKKLSEMLRLLRESKNLTQGEIASKLDLLRGTYANYELGTRTPDLDILKSIAKFYKISPEVFFGDDFQSNKQAIKIPILGKVIAGIPLEAIENIEGYEEITQAMASKGEFFGLKVKGISMYPYYMEDDIVIVKKQNTAEDGDIAIVMINGYDATIKKIQKKQEGITLSAFNPMVYEPHFYSNEEIANLPITIAGVVVESRRSEKHHIKPHI